MLTFKELKDKGFVIETNTTGAMIVDTIVPDEIQLDNLEYATYVTKNIIYDDCEQSYDLVRLSDDYIVYSTDDYDELLAEIERRLK